MPTTTAPGRHRRTPAPGHVPTDRTNARCRCSRPEPCPRHLPDAYAHVVAKHRADRS